MEYLTLEIEINPWEGILYEIIGRFSAKITPTAEGVPVNRPLWGSAREVSMFPLSSTALAAQLPALRRALSSVDLRAGLGSSDDERLVDEFATQLYRFVFTGELRRLLEEARAAAVQEWKGVRLNLRVSAPQLEQLPWEVLWSILGFDLKTMRRGMFDLRVDRVPRGSLPARQKPAPKPVQRLEPHATVPVVSHAQTNELLRQADTAFYAADLKRAVGLYGSALELEPGLKQARESMTRADACLLNREPRSTVPPRAAVGYRRAWDAYAVYRFDDALRWLNEAWLLAKDWGVATWPEATAFFHQIERSRAGWANFQKGLQAGAQGEREAALEAAGQAYRADPLETYRAQLEAWGRVFK